MEYRPNTLLFFKANIVSIRYNSGKFFFKYKENYLGFY